LASLEPQQATSSVVSPHILSDRHDRKATDTIVRIVLRPNRVKTALPILPYRATQNVRLCRLFFVRRQSAICSENQKGEPK
jgi:hypothetical protein